MNEAQIIFITQKYFSFINSSVQYMINIAHDNFFSHNFSLLQSKVIARPYIEFDLYYRSLYNTHSCFYGILIMKRISPYFRLQSNQKVRNYYSQRIYNILLSLTEENRLSSFKQIKQSRRDSLFFLTTLAANNKNLLFQFVPNSLLPEKRLKRSSSGFSEIILKGEMPFDEKEFLKKLIVQEINIRTSGFMKEERVLKIARELINEGVVKNAYKSTEHQDIGGTDIFFQFYAEDSMITMPLQVKSDFMSQKIHQEKYPDKPSIRVSFKTTDAVIRKKLKMIIENHQKRIILHI